MEALDWVLVVAESVLVPASIAFLLLARSRRARTMSVLVVLAVALTLAHPFGMEADEVGRIPTGAVQRDPSTIHSANVAGLPLMPFKLFRRDKPRLLEDYETEPSATLRARSWVWPFLFTSSSELAEMCEVDASVPCWEPERAGQTLGRGPYVRTLSLWSKDGDYWVRVKNPYAGRTDSPALPKQWAYRLRPAVTSWWALVFWLLAAGIVLVRTRHYAAEPTKRGGGRRAAPLP